MMKPLGAVLLLVYLIEGSHSRNITEINTTADSFTELYEKHFNAVKKHDVHSLKAQSDIIQELIEKTKDKLKTGTVHHSLNVTSVSNYKDLIVKLIIELNEIKHEIKKKSDREHIKPLHESLKKAFRRRQKMRHDMVQDLLNEKVEGDIRNIQGRIQIDNRGTSETLESMCTKRHNTLGEKEFGNRMMKTLKNVKPKRVMYHKNDEERREKLERQGEKIEDVIEKYVPKWKRTFGALQKCFLNPAEKERDSKQYEKDEMQDMKDQDSSELNGERAQIFFNEKNNVYEEDPEEFEFLESKRTKDKQRHYEKIKKIHKGRYLRLKKIEGFKEPRNVENLGENVEEDVVTSNSNGREIKPPNGFNGRRNNITEKVLHKSMYVGHNKENHSQSQTYASHNKRTSNGGTSTETTNKNDLATSEELDDSYNSDTNGIDPQDKMAYDDDQTKDDGDNNRPIARAGVKTQLCERKTRKLVEQNHLNHRKNTTFRKHEDKTNTREESTQTDGYDETPEDKTTSKDFLNHVVSLFRPPASLLRNEATLSRSPCDPVTGIGVSILCLVSFVSILSLVLSITNFVLNDARAKNIFSFHSKA